MRQVFRPDMTRTRPKHRNLGQVANETVRLLEQLAVCVIRLLRRAMSDNQTSG